MQGGSKKYGDITFVGRYYSQDTKNCHGHHMDTTILCIYGCCYHFIGWAVRYRGDGVVYGERDRVIPCKVEALEIVPVFSIQKVIA